MSPQYKRIVVTGMGINTPIGDNLDDFYTNLIAGKSAISRWKWLENDAVYSKVGGDLSEYDVKTKVKSLKSKLTPTLHKRLRQLVKKAPFSTKISALVSADAWIDAGLSGMEDKLDPTRRATLVGGHNLNERYFSTNYETFLEEPDYIDSMAALLVVVEAEPAGGAQCDRASETVAGAHGGPRLELADEQPGENGAGYRADAVQSGQAALEAINERPYDVVLMDVQMPERDGLDTTRLIRHELADARQPFIVALTAHSADDDRRRCLDAGMDAYLSKPIRIDRLASTLTRAPRLRAASDER